MVNPGREEGGASRKKFFVVHQKVAALEEKKSLGNRRVKMRRGFHKSKSAGGTRDRVPEGQGIKHAGAECGGVMRVAELEGMEEGQGGKAVRGKDVDHVVGGGANIKASTFAGGESEASEEKAGDGKAIVKGERTEGFHRDDFLHQERGKEDPSWGCEVVRRGVLEKSNFSIVVRINFPGKNWSTGGFRPPGDARSWRQRKGECRPKRTWRVSC